MKALSLILSLNLITASLAYAQSGELYADIEVTGMQFYSERPQNSEDYNLVETEALTRMKLSGSGFLSNVSEDINQKSHDVIGSNLSGYSKTKLEKRSGSDTSIWIVTKSDMKKDGIRIQESTKIEGEITEGNWNSYTEGEIIKFQYTKKGAEQFREEASTLLSKTLSDQMNKELQGRARISAKSKVSPLSDLGTCQANLEKMQCHFPKIKTHVTLKVRL